ncbi:MAG: FecR domain-containing protein [Phycisphaerales bacterium]|nr:MAG: FecR domain-containing protein [Phycisphaerales bacterium]
MGDLKGCLRQSHELAAHLASCQICAQEYESSRAVATFIRQNRALFAAALEPFEVRQKAARTEIEGTCAQEPSVGGQVNCGRFARLGVWICSAVASLALTMPLFLTLSNSGPFERPSTWRGNSLRGPCPTLTIELLSHHGSTRIARGTPIKTGAGELRTLVINGKHRLMLNSDSVVEIDVCPNRLGGCMVQLTSGEVFARVEHDGTPFIVRTIHGRAVITGTAFDMQVTDTATTLAILAGTVEFESDKGSVEVAAGQLLRIIDGLAPSKPVSCDIATLMSWTAAQKNKSEFGAVGGLPDNYDLSDLWLGAVAGPVSVEEVDYKDRIDTQRDWSRSQFPWTFQLQEALAREGIEVDYPELLVMTEDVWRFVYAADSRRFIPMLSPMSFLKSAERSGFDQAWLEKSVPTARPAAGGHAALGETYRRAKAFEKWAESLRGANDSSGEIDPAKALYSLGAFAYLANTRTLAWFAVRQGLAVYGDLRKSSLLSLLRREVDIARLTRRSMLELLMTPREHPMADCSYPEMFELVIRRIEALCTCELIRAKIERGEACR